MKILSIASIIDKVQFPPDVPDKVKIAIAIQLQPTFVDCRSCKHATVEKIPVLVLDLSTFDGVIHRIGMEYFVLEDGYHGSAAYFYFRTHPEEAAKYVRT
jgi:RecJ-like exonuclease